MAYDFNFDLETVAPQINRLIGLTQGLLTSEPQEDKVPQSLPLLKEQPVNSEPPSPEPQEQIIPQEQIGGTEMVNKAVASAISQTPNPLALRIKKDILQAKEDYATANTDEQRAAAQAKAGLLRGIAQPAGIDLSGYGTEDSYADAYKNFYTQQAKDLMEAMQGQYAGNSRQYYNDAYIYSLQNGYSPRKAKMIADMATNNYQEDRTQYLTGLLNSYGRDGLVTNEYGIPIIGALGDEGSPLANFYATTYPGPKEAYNRMTTLEDIGIKNQHELDLLGVGLKNDLKKTDAQTEGNIKYGQAQAGWQKERDERQQGYEKENSYDKFRYSVYLANNQGRLNEQLAKLEGAITQQNQTQLEKLKHELGIDTKEYDFLLSDRQWRQQIVQLSSLADYFGYEDDGKRDFMMSALGIKAPDQNGNFDKASVENGKKFHDMLDADEKNILKQLEDLGFDADPQYVAQLQAKLADVRGTKQQIEDAMGEQLGISAPKRSVREYSDDETANNETLSYLWSQANGDINTYRQYVSNWLNASGVTPHFKEQYLKALKAPQ